MRRIVRSTAVVAVGAVLIAPVVLDRDSFPLATYPMYARDRPAEVSFVTAQGRTADGEIRTLSLGIIGASDDPLVVAGELRSAVRRGDADQQCVAIASRVAKDADVDADADVTSVEVVTERHDTVASLEGDDSLRDRQVHATCGVPA